MEEKKSFVVRLDIDIWKELKRISYEQNISLNNLIKKGAEIVIKKYPKSD